MSNKNLYIQKFKDLGLQTWRIKQVDQTWYKQRFEWKIEFNFTSQDDPRGRYGNDHRWVQILRECEINNFEFRKRREVWTTLYTSDERLLNHILDREEYRSAIVGLEYSNDIYLKEHSAQTQLEAITDIKYVKNPTEFCYQVFLGNFEWGKDSDKKPITEYLIANSDDFLFKGYYQEIIHRCKHSTDTMDQFGRYRGVYDGFNFFAKSTEDILILHMIAPGKVRKIIKIMERN